MNPLLTTACAWAAGNTDFDLPSDDGDNFFWENAVFDRPCTIGSGVKIWHFAHIMAGAEIGRDSTIGESVHVGPHVKIGAGCKIQNGAQLFEGVTLEDEVFIGPHVVFTNVLTPRAFIDRKAEFKPTHVGHGASIGANATILCGVTIGDYAMVGAGSVVTKDVPPHAIVYGSPAAQPNGQRWACICGGPVIKWFGISPREVKACACGRAWAVGVNNLFEPAALAEANPHMRRSIDYCVCGRTRHEHAADGATADGACKKWIPRGTP